MADKLDLTPEKVRIKDSYRERIFAESQQLGKSYLEHRFSNRGTEEKSTESEVNNGEENKVNACQPMLITAMKA